MSIFSQEMIANFLDMLSYSSNGRYYVKVISAIDQKISQYGSVKTVLSLWKWMMSDKDTIMQIGYSRELAANFLDDLNKELPSEQNFDINSIDDENPGDMDQLYPFDYKSLLISDSEVPGLEMNSESENPFDNPNYTGLPDITDL